MQSTLTTKERLMFNNQALLASLTNLSNVIKACFWAKHPSEVTVFTLSRAFFCLVNASEPAQAFCDATIQVLAPRTCRVFGTSCAGGIQRCAIDGKVDLARLPLVLRSGFCVLCGRKHGGALFD